MFDFDIRRLSVFEAVARHLNFTTAGVELNLAQTAVSRQIRCLEQELGVTLFNRNRRHVELTTAGASLLGQLPQLQKTLGDCLRSLRDVGVPLRIGVIISAVQWFLPAILQELSSEAPDLEIQLQDMSPDRQSLELQRGTIALSLTRSTDAAVESLLTEQYLFVCPAQSAESSVQAALVKYPLIVLEPEGYSQSLGLIENWFCDRDMSLQQVRKESSVGVVTASVASGLACGVLPGCCLMEARESLQAYRLPSPPTLNLAVQQADRPELGTSRVLSKLRGSKQTLQSSYTHRLECFGIKSLC